MRVAHIGGTEAHKGYSLFKHAVFAAAPTSIDVMVIELAFESLEERREDWNGTPVRLIPKTPQAEVDRLYEDIDVLFAPLLWPESFGLVTREAIAAGCWVVASDRGAVGEPVIEGVNGHIVSVDTIAGLVEVIKKIDADPARYKGEPGAAPPPRLSKDQAIDLAAIYRDLRARSAPSEER